MADNDSPSGIIAGLHETFRSLTTNPCPFVAGPESLKKRASVALIVRIQPNYHHWPHENDEPSSNLDTFFGKDWVQHGEPEVLLIKRASRVGDRWTGHIALPGGRRDPEDEDDKAAAIRETSEEVGIDLSEKNALWIGNLPQRVVTAHWGKVPLMVLCPYVFLVTRHDLPPMRLQPTEVASAHWVSLRSLLAPQQRTVAVEDVANRLANQETGVKRWMLRVMVGKMVFAAIRLLPSESLYSDAPPIEGKGQSELQSFYNPPGMISTLITPTAPSTAVQAPPLILWGLTLGVVADFLDLLPPHNALELWTYPTFTPWDVRAVISIMTYQFRKRKWQEIQIGKGSPAPAVAVEEGLDAVSLPSEDRLKEAGMHGLGTGVDRQMSRMLLRSSAVGTMLEGYYDIVRKAVAIALISRTSAIIAISAWIWARYRRRL